MSTQMVTVAMLAKGSIEAAAAEQARPSRILPDIWQRATDDLTSAAGILYVQLPHSMPDNFAVQGKVSRADGSEHLPTSHYLPV